MAHSLLSCQSHSLISMLLETRGKERQFVVEGALCWRLGGYLCFHDSVGTICLSKRQVQCTVWVLSTLMSTAWSLSPLPSWLSILLNDVYPTLYSVLILSGMFNSSFFVLGVRWCLNSEFCIATPVCIDLTDFAETVLFFNIFKFLGLLFLATLCHR